MSKIKLQKTTKNATITQKIYGCVDAVFFLIDCLESDDDKKLIEDLYVKYISWLRFRASKIIGNDPAACADVAHDCMVNMIKHLDKLKTMTEDKQRAYMYVSIDNTALNYVAKHSRSVLMHKPEAAELDFVGEDYSLEADVEKRLNIEAVLENIHLLPKRDKDLIILKYELELSDEQVGDILDIKPGNVRMTLRRSVQKLAKLIDKKGAVKR